MRPFRIFNRTPFIESLFAAKKAEYELCNDPEGFPDYNKPIVNQGDVWIAGELPILLYLDSLIIQPKLLPTDPADLAASIQFLDEAHNGIEINPMDWMEILQAQPFLLGERPYAPDLYLASFPSHTHEYKKYSKRVFNYFHHRDFTPIRVAARRVVRT